MAMTKAEQKRMADLEDALRRARAMRWPEYNMPAPMTEADIKANLVEGGIRYQGREPQQVARGYFANSYNGRVSYGCSNGTSHNADGDVTSTQNMGVMYATKADAWRAVRYQMTERFSAQLAKVDQEIADAESGERP